MSSEDHNTSKEKLLLAALELLPTHCWEQLSLELIANEAGVPIDEARQHFDTLTDLVPASVHMINKAVNKAYTPDKQTTNSEDKLFDILMTRFEKLQEHRAGIIALGHEGRRRPELAFRFYQAQIESIENMWERTHETPPSTICTHALLLIYQYVYGIWEDDSSKDLASTMAALDNTLKKIKKFGLC